MVITSCMCSHTPFAPTDLEICMRGHVADVINRAIFLKISPRVSELHDPKNGLSYWKYSSPLQQCTSV